MKILNSKNVLIQHIYPRAVLSEWKLLNIAQVKLSTRKRQWVWQWHFVIYCHSFLYTNAFWKLYLLEGITYDLTELIKRQLTPWLKQNKTQQISNMLLMLIISWRMMLPIYKSFCGSLRISCYQEHTQDSTYWTFRPTYPENSVFCFISLFMTASSFCSL